METRRNFFSKIPTVLLTTEKDFSHWIKELVQFQNVVVWKRRKFAGMLYKLDESVGIVVDKLKEFFIPIQFYRSILNLHF